MEEQDTKRIRTIMIYWIISSVLFIVDGVLKALPAYRNPNAKSILPHLQLGIETPIMVNPDYLAWAVFSFIGFASIISLIIVLWRPQKSKDIYFVGLIPIVLSAISVSYGAANFWNIVLLISNLMIANHSLRLTGRVKQAFDHINRVVFQNTKIVTVIVWSITSAALILDSVLRAFPESQVDGVSQLIRGIIECIGAGLFLTVIFLQSDKISNRVKFRVGLGTFAATAIGFLIGFPASMTSIWMWIAIVLSVLTLIQFAKLYGEVKDIPTFNRKMNGLFWFLASAMALVNIFTVIFPLYDLQQKTIQLGVGISQTILAVSILIPLPIYIYDSMNAQDDSRNKITRKLGRAVSSEYDKSSKFVKGGLSFLLVIISSVALGWDLVRGYQYYIWSSIPDWTRYVNYLLPIVFNSIIGVLLAFIFYRMLFAKKNNKLDMIVSTLPLAFSLINLILYLNVQPLSFYISWVPIFVVSLFVFFLGLRIRDSKTSKWTMILVGLIPSIVGILSFILSIKAEELSFWSWLSLIFGIFATSFAILVTGNPNNQGRKVIGLGKTWKIFKSNWMGITGFILLITIVILAIGGSNLTKWDPDSYGESDPLMAPSITHVLGTNRYGQDVFTVLLDSLGISLLIGIIAGSLTVIIGTTIGVASAYLGGWVDTVIMRITDIILVMPALPLMLVLASLPFLFGKVHWSVIAVVYIVVFWPVSARLIRGQALSIKERAFVTSAKSSGAGSRYIIFKHVLPNVFPLMLTMIISSMRQAILYESFLSYLGLGDPLNWTLGQMLYIAQNQAALSSGAWWMFFPPGLAIGLITLSFAFIGMALDEIVNPRLRKR